MENFKLRMLYWLCRILLGGFFCLAGVLKALDPAAFQVEILAYQLVGYPVSYLVAHVLPFFEILLGLSVLMRIQIRFASGMIILLLMVFIAALCWSWMKGIDLHCGCLGKIDFIEGQPAAILRDIVLVGMAMILWRWQYSGTKGTT